MTADGQPDRQRVLSPADRYSEILFGLIMALSFTCALSVAEAGEAEVRTMLIAALSCNTAWGIVDGIMYMLDALTERGRGLVLLRRFEAAREPAAADAVIREALPDVIANALEPRDVETMRARLATVAPVAQGARLTLDDLRGAVGVALLVIVSTVPVALPFVFLDQPATAVRASNAVANGLLFVMGWQQGRYAGVRPWLMALAMVGIGMACVSLTMALGG
jgi:VIT1/CCC1 family predicted Fe2+/Mn2+ transporter